ncbi:MAG: anti-sigma factor [Proteobacteria bacterium]|nr:anti-sigma factor [Pseudomonadota bacterium]
MAKAEFSDETLMAFADGELDPETTEAVEQAIETDETIAQRVAEFMESRDMAKDAFAPLLEEPVPESLTSSVEEMIHEQTPDTTASDETVVAFTPMAPKQHKKPAYSWQIPLAASITLIIGLGAGYTLNTAQEAAETSELGLASLSQPQIVEALVAIPSGMESQLGGEGDRFRAIATYRNADGTLCREFEVDQSDKSTVVAVACRPEQRWNVRFAVVAGPADSGYAPASSLESLDAYLDAVDAGEPLSLEDEKAALEELK